MISVLLTALMAVVFMLALLMRRRSPAVSLAFGMVAAVGTWFAWRPEDLNHLARALGVGRGADLALYLGLSLSFLALAALLLQLRHLQNRFTLLAREVALIQARHSHANAAAAPGQASGPGSTPPGASKSTGAARAP